LAAVLGTDDATEGDGNEYRQNITEMKDSTDSVNKVKKLAGGNTNLRSVMWEKEDTRWCGRCVNAQINTETLSLSDT